MHARTPVVAVAMLFALAACLSPAVAAAGPRAVEADAVAASLTPEPSPSPTPPHVVMPRVQLKVPAGVWLGDTVSVTVSVAPDAAVVPGLAAAPVALEVQTGGAGGAWSVEATATLGAGSRARLSWRPALYGPVRARASLPAGEGYAAAVSATKRLIVNRPNKHHVPYKSAHYIVIVVHEYKLYYYEHGAVARSFDVALGRPGYRTPLGTFHIYYKRRPAGGALGSCAMFYRHAGGIAIHGTDQPQLLRRFPRPFSHGCARMYNSQALWLYEHVPKGTVVRNIR
jgi:lipoprotein-anchoring transpeptidase ErfK/SrfK